MRSTQQFSITLTNDMAEMVRSKVESGQYVSESEVIREGLRSLQFQEQAVEAWLASQVAPAYDAIKAGRTKALSAKQIRSSLASARTTGSKSE